MFLFLSSELAFYFLPELHEIPSCRPLPYFRTLITALSDFCSWNKKICPFASNVVSIRIVQHKNQCYNIVFYLVVCQLIIFNSLDSLEFYPYLCYNCCLINIENNDKKKQLPHERQPFTIFSPGQAELQTISEICLVFCDKLFRPVGHSIQSSNEEAQYLGFVNKLKSTDQVPVFIQPVHAVYNKLSL